MAGNLLNLLDQVSVFTEGQTLPRNKIPKVRIHKKHPAPKKENCEEMEIFAKVIGYELDDNEDLNDFQDSYVQHNRNRRQVSPPNKNGFGRGKIINFDDINFSVFNRLDSSRRNQEYYDRVIGEQLREVVGSGTSNEEIEEYFNKKYKTKNFQKDVVSDGTSDSDVASSIDTDSKKSKPDKKLYVPPHLRVENMSPTELTREKEIYQVSKLDDMFQIDDQEIEFQQNCESNAEDNSSNSSENEYKDKINLAEQKNIKTKDAPKLFKSRNALINGLLRKNPSLVDANENSREIIDKKKDNSNIINSDEVNLSNDFIDNNNPMEIYDNWSNKTNKVKMKPLHTLSDFMTSKLNLNSKMNTEAPPFNFLNKENVPQLDDFNFPPLT